MRRKVFKTGPASLTISLPSKWIKKHGIKKGDEIEVWEEDNNLVCGIEKKEITKERKEINVGGLDYLTKRIIGALYKKGYDELIVNFKDSNDLEKLQEVSNRLIGLDIIEERGNKLIIKKLASAEIEEYENIFRKSFLFLLAMSEDTFDAVNKNDKEVLKGVIIRDRNLNKFTDFCRRILIKNGLNDHKQVPPSYVILFQLEKIGDVYKGIANYYLENKIKYNPEFINLFKEVNSILRTYYELFYKFDLKKANKMIKEKDKIILKTNKIFKTSLRNNWFLFFSLRLITNQISDIAVPLLIIQL